MDEFSQSRENIDFFSDTKIRIKSAVPKSNEANIKRYCTTTVNDNKGSLSGQMPAPTTRTVNGTRSTPRVHGNRPHAEGSLKKRLTEDELESMLARMTAINARKLEDFRRQELDLAVFEARSVEAAQKVAVKEKKEGAHQLELDEERRKNREQRLKAMDKREWDMNKWGQTGEQEENETVLSSQLKDETVLSGQLKEETVLSGQLKEETVLTGQLKDETVLSGQLKDETVLSGQLKDETVLSGQLKDETVLSGQLKDETVLSGQLKDETVLSGQLKEETVLSGQLEEETVLSGQKEERLFLSEQEEDRRVLSEQEQERPVLTEQEEMKRARDEQAQKIGLGHLNLEGLESSRWSHVQTSAYQRPAQRFVRTSRPTK